MSNDNNNSLDNQIKELVNNSVPCGGCYKRVENGKTCFMIENHDYDLYICFECYSRIRRIKVNKE